MKTTIHSGSVITPNKILPDTSVIIEETIIHSIFPGKDSSASDLTIDAYGCFISPGWIDLHTHGAAGYDFIQSNPEAYNTVGAFFAEHGVTRYLPTLMEKDGLTFDHALPFLKTYSPIFQAAKPLGAHLEGPYFNSKFPGDMNPKQLRSPQPAEYQNWFESGQVKLMTLAPELDGAAQLIAYGRQNGVSFALGHCDPDEVQVAVALEKGADQVSHLFNQMAGLHHRNPGLANVALLNDHLACQIIADQEHLHPAILKLIYRLKPINKIILVTDSTADSGLTNSHPQSQESSRQTVPGKLTMDQAVRNMIRFSGASLLETINMASNSPASALGLEKLYGNIQPGNVADILLLDNQLNVILTMIAGQIVFDPQNRSKGTRSNPVL